MIRASWPTSCSKLPARRAPGFDTRQVPARASCDCFADSHLAAWSTPAFEKTCGSTRCRPGADGIRRRPEKSTISGGELLQDVLHRRGALLPGRQLGLDAQLLGAGEAGVAAFLADEVDHLGAVERRVLDELELHRLVRDIDPRHAERPRGDAHHVAPAQ